MIGQTLDADPPIGRLISDYSHPPDASPMFPGKKALNKAHFTTIRNPRLSEEPQSSLAAHQTRIHHSYL